MAEVEMVRLVPVEPAVVFRAFTTPAELAEWWGPEGFTIPSVALDARPGGSYRIEMQPPEGAAFFLTGEFRIVEPPRRLAYTFNWEPPDPDDVETTVDLSFADAPEGTRIGFTQGEFKTEARRQLHFDGWTDTFAKLAQFLAT